MIGKPVEWGVDDCILAAADVCLAQTGHDPAADLRGQWRSRREALRFIARRGGTLRSAIDAILCSKGFARVAAAEAQPGDAGLLCFDGIETCACRIDAGWFLRKEGGFVVLPAVHAAWRRPCAA